MSFKRLKFIIREISNGHFDVKNKLKFGTGDKTTLYEIRDMRGGLVFMRMMWTYTVKPTAAGFDPVLFHSFEACEDGEIQIMRIEEFLKSNHELVSEATLNKLTASAMRAAAETESMAQAMRDKLEMA